MKNTDYIKQWKKDNKSKVKKHNRTYYLKNRENILKNMSIKVHTLTFRKHRAELREQQRIRVLTCYGNGKLACVMCGEDKLPCLTIDHINDDGAEHRRIIGNSICSWIERNNYPDGFQTLCMNDQWLKKYAYEKSRLNDV